MEIYERRSGPVALSEPRTIVKGMPWELKGSPSRESQKIVILIIIAVRTSDLAFSLGRLSVNFRKL
jgi:hypothetical protein